ncbi:MAG: RNA polymerase-binding transcription factor DksA [Myxococcota bacterium]|jgi:RNA polymerase-binding transcription factor DksA
MPESEMPESEVPESEVPESEVPGPILNEDGVKAAAEQRLKLINAKGWEVAQRLSAVKARRDIDLSQMDGMGIDDPLESKERRLRRYLDQINRARTRLPTPEYGQCVDCGTAFAAGQLDDMPWVEQCAGCAANS